ncbi:MAG: N-acetyltransferase [Planctomycetota bacterium]|nr:N-acetyltransferase [Planctomycetota bacterium]
MVEFRCFKNSDPPRIVELWHKCRFGRGAAGGFNVDALETLMLSQPYFRRDGFIIALDGESMVGFVHAGFGCNADESAISTEHGAICAIGVRPEFRRKGIGRELMQRAESYLKSNGASQLQAGPAAPHNPFYLGLYGGSEPSGFLESDASAAPFLKALGYASESKHIVFQREVAADGDPVNMKLMQNRRKLKMAIKVPPPPPVTWWWSCRFGRLDSLMFELLPKAGGDGVASVNVVGLDLYRPKWKKQAIGLSNLWVEKSQRGNGYGQTLLVEVCRRLRDERVTTAEVHAIDDNEAMKGAAKAAGFRAIDTGIVYSKNFSV